MFKKYSNVYVNLDKVNFLRTYGKEGNNLEIEFDCGSRIMVTNITGDITPDTTVGPDYLLYFDNAKTEEDRV